MNEDACSYANHAAHEAVQMIRTVHAHNLQSRVVAVYSGHLAAPTGRMCRAGVVSGLCFGLSQLVRFAYLGLSFWCAHSARACIADANRRKAISSEIMGSIALGILRLPFP